MVWKRAYNMLRRVVEDEKMIKDSESPQMFLADAFSNFAE